MKSQKKEQGSALHIIIVTVLVVAILGVLGYAFYRELATKTSKPAASTQQSQSKTPTADPGYAYFSGGTQYGLPTNVRFEYPTGWQVVDSAHSVFGKVGNDPSALFHDSGSLYLQTANTIAGYAAQHDGGQQANQATIIVTLDTRYQSLDDAKAANYKNDGQTISTVIDNQTVTITTHVHSVNFTLDSEPAVAFSELNTRSNGDNDSSAAYNNDINDIQDFFVQHDSKVYRIFVNGFTIDTSILQPVMNKLISSWKWL